MMNSATAAFNQEGALSGSGVETQHISPELILGSSRKAGLDSDIDPSESVVDESVLLKKSKPKPKPKSKPKGKGNIDLDEMGEFFGEKNARRDKRKRMSEPDELDKKMGQATLLYASQKFPEAIEILHEVIGADPQRADAWKMRAFLYEEQGDHEQAYKFNFIAAHMDRKDADLWKRLAEISVAKEFFEEALYCYAKAIKADPTDLESLLRRSLIFSNRGIIQKAISGFLTILKISPQNMQAITELARIYTQLHEIKPAIKLYEAAIDADARNPIYAIEEDALDDDADEDDDDNNDEDEDYYSELSGLKKPPISKKSAIDSGKERIWRVNYEMLLKLVNLYIKVEEYDNADIAIETVIGRLEHGVADIMNSNFVNESFVNLPIELRVKFGICKVWLGDNEAAKTHFAVLNANNVNQYSKLFIEVADVYMKKRMFLNAVDILSFIIRDKNQSEKDDKSSSAIAWAKCADCFQNLGKLQEAVELYKYALEVNPREYDWQFQLAEIYKALGEHEKANAIAEEVNELTREDLSENALKSRLKVQKTHIGPSYAKSGGVENGDDGENKDIDSDSDYEFEGSDDEVVFDTAKISQKLLKPTKTTGKYYDKAVIKAAMKQAVNENKEWYTKMIELQTKINDLTKRADFIRYARKLVSKFQSERMFYPADRVSILDLKFANAPYYPKSRIASTKEEQLSGFQGLTFEKWFEVFILYAMALSFDKKEEDAYLALKTALDANIFYHNIIFNTQIRLYMIAAAVMCGNYGRVTELARNFCVLYPHDNDMYRLYCTVLSGGTDAVSAFASKYYIDAYKMVPTDPLINLSTGLAFLHWGMTRSVDNRHRRILQAFTFLFQYEELRNGNPEALYNLGRAFQQLGLNTYAVEYYQKVLSHVEEFGDDAGNTWPVKEAAYNLSLIFYSNGSNAYAQAILANHLSF
ncbi:transcription factor TFIIIC subunit tfc4 [Physocladia obscura]|uniref:Transcription factor TFIIIC subunit tfc4 n=1 Tax=Physocladia obscura TaxID=109957 RepID=A0AAD5TB67_9FUNG|nr:transcription factor TFIIIC subunit tfc4 [Physocladia obscura]